MSSLDGISALSLLFFLFALQAMYMFFALAIVCDDYFVVSLEKICEVTKLPGLDHYFKEIINSWDSLYSSE